MRKLQYQGSTRDGDIYLCTECMKYVTINETTPTCCTKSPELDIGVVDGRWDEEYEL